MSLTFSTELGFEFRVPMERHLEIIVMRKSGGICRQWTMMAANILCARQDLLSQFSIVTP